MRTASVAREPRPASAYVSLVVLLVLASGCTRVIKHSPAMAARIAREFGDAAFVQESPQTAARCLDIQLLGELGPDGLAAALARMHPSGRPGAIEATAYEPQPGQRAILIFCEGRSVEERFYYRMLMIGDERRGYKVRGFERSPQPFAVGPARKAL